MGRFGDGPFSSIPDAATCHTTARTTLNDAWFSHVMVGGTCWFRRCKQVSLHAADT